MAFRSKSSNEKNSAREAKEGSKSARGVLKIEDTEPGNQKKEEKKGKAKLKLGNLVQLLKDMKTEGEETKRGTLKFYLEGDEENTSLQEIFDEYRE